MKKNYLAAALLLSCALLSAPAVQAEENFVNPTKLKSYGIDAEKYFLTGFSHDGSFIMLYQPNTPKKKLEGLGFKLFIVNLSPSGNNIESVKEYEVPVTKWEYSMLTPDQKDIIIVTKAGATFVKFNLETGKSTILHENIPGQPGFRAYPQVLHYVDGEIFCTGYFHNEEGLCDVDCNATLDPNKEGVAAFHRVYDVQGMMVKMAPKAWTFTKKDMGFFCSEPDNYKDTSLMLEWNPPEMSKPKIFDVGKALYAMWGAQNRLLYTMQREDNTFDLVLYDGTTCKKTFLDKGNKDMYFNLFMSADGKTALFTDTKNRVKRAAYFYADEANGWKITPVADFRGQAKPFGEIRISDDGSKMVIKSKQGLTVANVKG